MASKGINWNIVIIGGAAVGALYFLNKLQKPTAENYSSGITGETISEATQPTIRTDLRQSARTQRVGLRTERVGIRQTERTARAEGRQAVRINKADERTARVNIRQTQRTARFQIRTQAAQQLRSNVVKAVANVTSKAKTTIQSKISAVKAKVKRK